MHSSTVTVFVHPEGAHAPTAPYAQRGPEAFAHEWYSGSGAGGQHRNKHQNSVRLRHLPTGLVATSQCRSRAESLRHATADLLARLDAMAAGHAAHTTNTQRAAVIGSGMRADKRRTWRFQDDQAIDHLTGRTARCSDLLRGRFHALWA